MPIKEKNEKCTSAAAIASLKGCAITLAIEAGMIPRTEKDDGYKIGSFLQFWDSFSQVLSKHMDQIDNNG